MKRRVVVTGMGAVTPIGNTVDEFWKGIRAGVVGIGEITKFDTTDYKVKLAAEVKNFDVKERLDFKAARRMDTFSQFAVAAGKRLLNSPAFVWRRKIRFVWASLSARGSEVFRKQKKPAIGFGKKDRRRSILLWFLL